MTRPPPRCFIFLQGPHGPFFDALGAALRTRGHKTFRVGFNRGDERFWRDPGSYIPYRGTSADWPDAFAAMLAERGATDLVVYGDTRGIHAAAIDLANERGLRIHVFEEGYLRPYWSTYERDGSNGHSRLMQMSVADMEAALPAAQNPQTEAPTHWGDMRQHVFYGALYHFYVMFRNRAYQGFRPHRALPVAAEFRLHLRRLILMPLHRAERVIATARIRLGRFPYHLVLLQLEHDASFRDHSDLGSMADFVGLCLEGFAAGSAPGDHLVFKAHPLEDGRIALRQTIRDMARARGVGARVHFVRGGKLARLLDRARSVVTVNSTAAQQALWRALPVRALGRAVYSKPELVSDQPLAAFFATPHPPDMTAYRAFRRYLLATSQIAGGFYSARGRALLLTRAPDLMLSPDSPYVAPSDPQATLHRR